MHFRTTFLAAAALAVAAATAHAETTRAKQAILIEYPANRVIFAKASDKPMAPSSMTKLMTLYLAFEALDANRVTDAATVKVSRRTAETRGAEIGLAAGDGVSFGELVRATAIASANDAAVALAEHLQRSEGAFAKAMTAKARELGLIDGIADLRSKMRELHGDKVRLKPVPLAGGGLLSRLRRLPGFRAITNDGFAFPPSFADDAISAVEARALWSRFGL